MTPPTDRLDDPAIPRLGLTVVTIAAIFMGGALGTVSRYLLDSAHSTPSGHFPVTTLCINVSGSLAIGFAIPVAEKLTGQAPWLRPFAIVGVLGGWTTYSTLAVDAVLLAKGGHAALTVGYLAATVLGGIAIVVVGNALGRQVVGS
jgi:fluoride exporter